MDVMNILYFVGVSILLTLMPGPDILFIISESMSKNRKTGIYIAFGLCTGLIVHTMAAALGISAIFYHSAVAFQIVKLAGALYLFYLAWQSLQSKRGDNTNNPFQSEQQPFLKLYRRGILMNVLNPKVSIFFLAFLPQFVSPQVGSVPFQMMVLGIIFTIQALVVFSIVSILANHLGKFILKNEKTVLISRVKAGIYTLLGARLVFLDR